MPLSLPLSAAQFGIWMGQQLALDSPAYNMGQFVEIEGPVDEAVFERSLQHLVSEADCLRVRFTDGPRQILTADDVCVLRNIDFRPRADPRAACDEWMLADLLRPMNLTADLLVRFALLRVGDTTYRFYCRVHHIVFDAYSGALLTSRLAEIYTAFIAGTDPGDNPFGSLRDLIDDDLAYRASPAFGADREYWMSHVDSGGGAVGLSDRLPRIAVRTLRRSSYLSPQESDLVRTTARAMKTSAAGLLIASAGVYVGRATGSDDAVLGMTVTGRKGALSRRVPTMMANVVPVRVRLDPRHSFREVVREVTLNAREALAHQRYRFEDLRRDLGRHDGRTRLFGPRVNAVPINTTLMFGGSVATVSMLSTGPVDDLAITAYADPAGTRLRVDLYASEEVYRPDELRQHEAAFVQILRETVERPDDSVRKLGVPRGRERRLLLSHWNATEEPVPQTTLPALVEAQVDRTPDALAAVSPDGVLTYRQLDQRANRMARLLAGRGVGPETLVAVLLGRSVDLVVAFLAVLKAGGSYVPIDPANPRERIDHVVRDAAPLLTIASNETAPAVSGQAVLLVDDPAVLAELAALPDSRLERAVRPAHPAYVIYTSGSTGGPKGVVVCHQNLVNYLTRSRQVYPDLAEGTLVHTSTSFDLSVTALYGALVSGGRVHLTALDDAPALLGGVRYPFLKATPSHIPLLSNLPEEAIPTRQLMLGGEPVTGTQLREVRRRFPELAVVNHYGPTETTVGCADFHIGPDDAIPAEAVPIGRPMWNTQIYVLDSGLEPVAPGVPGELYIAGAQLARGYHHQPGLTAHRFVANPYGPPGTRMYRTGDLARWNPNGQLEYLGRIDHQVKIRGHRVELAEIETTLTADHTIAHTTVTLREDRPGDRRLVAYVVPADGAVPDPVRLNARVAATVPDYMVPAAIVVLDALPLTPNGKLDRAALPAPEFTAVGRPPTTLAEEVLCAAVAKVLGLDSVGVDDNFFDLGGHSVLAMTLTGRLREQGWVVTARALFDTPTVAGLAAAAARDDTQAPANAIPADARTIEPHMLTLVSLSKTEIARVVSAVPGGAPNIADIYPLAPLQEGLFFHHLTGVENGRDVYLLPAVLEFDSRDRMRAFTAALQKVVDRHDILRTAVLWEGLSQPVQVVVRHAEMPVQEVYLHRSADPVRQLLDAAGPVMDIRRAPMLHVYQAASAAAGRWLALVQRHHLVTDHTAMGVLLDEVRAVLDGREDQLPAPLPFRTFVAAARRHLADPQHRDHFARLLGDVTEPSAPFGVVDVQSDGTAVRQARATLSADLARRLRVQARGLGTIPAAVFHLIWARVTAATAARQDVVFGTVLSGRIQSGVGADRVPGVFINALPVRVRIDATPVVDAVLDIRTQLAELLVHEHAPLLVAQQASGLPPRVPLFTALFNYRRVPDTEPDHTDLPGTTLRYLEEHTNYPLDVSVDDTGSTFRLTVDAVTPIDPELVATLIMTATENLVHALETDPHTPIAAVEVLPASDRQRLAAAGNLTAHAVPESTVPALFEMTVAGTPDAAAVVSRDATLTYTELDRRANRLAHMLVARGVGPETLVAILLPPSADLVVAMLAVLKAGGAYVPLDPANPRERVELILRDARPALVLTSDGTAPTGRAPWLGLDDPVVRQALDELPDGPPPRRVRPDHPAYVIYTSGSTGGPKGVVVSHRSLVNYLTYCRTVYPELAHSAVLPTSVSFDLSVTSLFGTLVSGGCLYLTSLDDAPALLGGRSYGFLSATPSHLPLLQTLRAQCTPVGRLMIGGEGLAGPQLVALRGRHADLPLVNEYGPTEATVGCVDHRLGPDEALPDGAVPIGRPIWNNQAYVLDEWLGLVPPGVPGELYIAGAQLARGYHHQPGLTAHRFVANPYGPPGTRMYRTGDLARWNPHGQLEYLGRIDHQVKIRGHRVELAEIETTLTADHTIAHTTVTVREDRPGDRRLVAYVVPSGPTRPEPGAVREHAARFLPDYMVPAAVVVLDALPLTANGKLDRRALPVPRYTTTTSRPPATLAEELVCTAFAAVLALDSVGVDDNFFQLGGHSLLAVRVIGRLREQGLTIPVRALLESPTPAKLAAGLSSASSFTASLGGLLPLQTRGDQPALFCIHPAGGLSWCYAPLVRFAPHDLPVYGLQAAGLDGAGRLPDSLPDMAADYIGQVRTVQSSGPYRLLGWSYGGLVAHEMARQLQAAGERVEALILLDAYPSVGSSELDSEAAARVGTLVQEATGDYIAEGAGWNGADLAAIVWNNARLAGSHLPGIVEGDIVLVVADQGDPDPAAWRPHLTGEIVEIRLPHTHAELARPDVLGRMWEAVSPLLTANAGTEHSGGNHAASI